MVNIKQISSSAGGGSANPNAVINNGTSTDNAIARFDGATGKIIQNSSVTLDDGANIQTVNSETFAVSPTLGTNTEGRISWNSEEHALQGETGVDGVITQYGRELNTLVVNKTGVKLLNGQIVYINGAQGNRPTVALLSASGAVHLSATKFLGMLTQDIDINQEGFVTTYGVVHGLNTNTLSEGQVLYVSPTIAGAYTTTMPSAPDSVIQVGVVRKSHITDGEILICPHFSNIVAISQSLGWVTAEPTGFDDKLSPCEDIVMTYDYTTRKITLTHSSGYIYYWWQGVQYAVTSPWTSTAHTNATNTYYLSIKTGGVITWGTDVWDFKSEAPVAAVKYDTGNSIYIAFRELHALMPWQAHKEFHEVIGTYKLSGGSLTAGTYAIQPTVPTDADNTPGIDSTRIADEDAYTTNSALVQGTYTKVYFTGSGTPTFSIATNPLRKGTTYPYYNSYNGATFSNVETSTNKYLNYWIVAVPTATDSESTKYRYLFLQPQREYSSLSAASAETTGDLNLGTLASLFVEFVPIAKVTVYTLAAYSTTGKYRIEAVTYLTRSRTNSVSGVGSITWGQITGTLSNQTDLQTALDAKTNLDRQKLEINYNQAYSTAYHELTYDINDKLTQIDIWQTSGKLLKLFTKVLTYTGDELTQVLITDEIASKTLTKVLAYDINGKLTSVTKTFV